tara:strand:- start:680 stop:1444 length:765 start_codon:yes stop_codon:yes gene_type:complete
VAQLIDEVTQEVDETNNEEAVLEETPEVAAEDDLPEQYRNKTAAELVKMHQEAESRIGQQGEEVGKLRSVVDDFILKQTKSTEPEEAEEIDYFADPDKAVEHKIANHPTIKQLEQLGVQMQQSQTLSALQQKHPDLKEIAMSPEFQKWVTGSKVRSQLYEQANNQYNYDAADELFSTWKEIRNVASQTVEVERKERKQALNAASTGGASGSTEAPSKKIYRRSDIIDLMRNDPKRYQSLSNEIMKAYQEGRVRN